MYDYMSQQGYRSEYVEPPERADSDFEQSDRREYHQEAHQESYELVSVAQAARAVKLSNDELINDYNHYSGFDQGTYDIKKGSGKKMSSSVFVNDEIEKVVDELKILKAELKKLEAKEERLKQALYNHMLDNEVLITHDGEIKATWSYAKPTVFFDAKRLEKENPHIYKSFMGVREGSRRLLLK